jgi:predicted nuclease with TOPRIM domain
MSPKLTPRLSLKTIELAGSIDSHAPSPPTTTPHSIAQDEEIRELEQQIEIQKRENELARLRGERDDLEDRLDSLQGELAQMRQELDEMRDNSVDREDIRELIADETTDSLTEDDTDLIRQHRRMFRPSNDDTVQAIARTIADKAVMSEWEVFCQECNR